MAETRSDDRHTTHPDDLPELVGYLEPDQLVRAKQQQPVARKVLGKRANVWLWALRVFVVVVTAMVLYTFVSQLHG
jgi:hypothetical protein